MTHESESFRFKSCLLGHVTQFQRILSCRFGKEREKERGRRAGRSESGLVLVVRRLSSLWKKISQWLKASAG